MLVFRFNLKNKWPLLFTVVLWISAPDGVLIAKEHTKASNYISLEEAILKETGNASASKVYKRVLRRLRRSGVPEDYLLAYLPRAMREVDSGIVQRWHNPSEKLNYSSYRKLFINNERIQKGLSFYLEHSDLLARIERQYGVDKYLLLSIVNIESSFGSNHQQYPVVKALNTIAHEFPQRAKWVEDELVAWFLACYRDSLDPITTKGSYAGAFGYMQFLPSSFKRYAVDFDGDKKCEPYEWPDVLASMANFLRKRGRYRPNSDDFSRGSANWRAVYKYNPSKNYVRAVLEYRDIMREKLTD